MTATEVVGVLFSVLVIFLVGSLASMRFIMWPLYVSMREERDRALKRVAELTASRDSWRSVAERALVVAQLGRSVSARAERIASVATAQPGRVGDDVL